MEGALCTIHQFSHYILFISPLLSPPLLSPPLLFYLNFCFPLFSFFTLSFLSFSYTLLSSPFLSSAPFPSFPHFPILFSSSLPDLCAALFSTQLSHFTSHLHHSLADLASSQQTTRHLFFLSKTTRRTGRYKRRTGHTA